MGSPKALLREPEGRTFLERILASMDEAGVADVTVVTGRHHEAIALALAGAPGYRHVRLVRNEEPDRGQLSSLWVGMDAVCQTETEAVIVTLVDVPLVRASTISAVVDAWRRTRAPIVRPRFDRRRGHPVVFDRAVFHALRAAPLESGARAVVQARLEEVVEVAVDDPGCIRDVDTPDEYRLMMQQPRTLEPRT
jgi:CTP:molybdopterin cytidylyltransferase MocA